ncbi:TPA: TRAM domain-containing protein [Klebsiella pneumoniae]|nr:TRAM domain-containing protein [Klebsiella pneumoniae]
MAQFYSAKRRVTTRQIITVTVNDLDPFGQGVARHQGKALFVSGVLPHEQAEVVLVEDKKQYARAEVKRRLTDSPQRQAPRCPHFGVCGGCQQQHASVPLQQQSKRAAHVVGVEGVPALVEKGRENAARNGLSNVTFFHENLEEDVTRQAWAKHGFDKVLLDPARAGAPGVMPHIIKLAPRRVVYVSCNPATLARDSETLLQAGYQIQRLAMLDMFPHTGHLESMVLFERRLT